VQARHETLRVTTSFAAAGTVDIPGR